MSTLDTLELDGTDVTDTELADVTGGQRMVCRYGGWFQYSDGRVVHVWICE